MRVVTYIAALGLLAAGGCSQMGFGQSNQNAQVPFDNGVRQNYAQPTTCSPADATCGTGIGNPSIQSPIQSANRARPPNKRALLKDQPRFGGAFLISRLISGRRRSA